LIYRRYPVTLQGHNLLHTPHDLTGDEYEVQARIHLGFQAVQIFGIANVTTSLKQIVSYFGYDVDKALSDAQITNKPLGILKMASWRLLTNKTNKTPCYFLEEETAPFQSSSIKNKVIQQQFAKEVFELTSRESTPQKSSSTKAERK